MTSGLLEFGGVGGGVVRLVGAKGGMPAVRAVNVVTHIMWSLGCGSLLSMVISGSHATIHPHL